ncbi:hypothetical protein [Diaphorobacter sp.]|uniref:hypothetical protein n=1 Tax=Diaphorobacter sp. TaxID=1934310 RepID=UPI00258A2A57|nr:hypothetical protein [Diaphorobacter sp.]
MSKLVDKAARLAAMANLAKHFLSQAYEGGNTAEEREARHDAMKDEVSPCGLFDAHDVVWLFYLLEERALTEINKFAALAQTTDPDAMLEHGVPSKLVANVRLLKEHHRKVSRNDSAAHARSQKPEEKKKAEFKAWAAENISKDRHSGKIQINDVYAMKGFSEEWRLSDTVMKKCLREAIPGFVFRTGRKAKK